MNCGVLLLREVDSYWFAIPNVGTFVKSCLKGRQEVISILKKTKWKEMLSEVLDFFLILALVEKEVEIFNSANHFSHK